VTSSRITKLGSLFLCAFDFLFFIHTSSFDEWIQRGAADFNSNCEPQRATLREFSFAKCFVQSICTSSSSLLHNNSVCNGQYFIMLAIHCTALIRVHRITVQYCTNTSIFNASRVVFRARLYIINYIWETTFSSSPVDQIIYSTPRALEASDSQPLPFITALLYARVSLLAKPFLRLPPPFST
jgi:hypothetical protein